MGESDSDREEGNPLRKSRLISPRTRERRRRIKKGQLARAEARRRERDIAATSMLKETGAGRASVATPGASQGASSLNLRSSAKKRKSDQLESERMEKDRRTSNGGGGSKAAENKESAAPPWEEMKAMMERISNQMGGVRDDIGTVRTELGEKIQESKDATNALKERMDISDSTFKTRVMEVMSTVGILPDGAGTTDDPAGPVPTFSSAGQSSSSRSYASCFSSTGILDRGVAGDTRSMVTSTSKEDRYWHCRRSVRLWPVSGPDLKTALGEFLRTRLRLDASFLADMGEVGIKKIASGPASKITGEITVLFSTVEVRDAVKRSAKELAGDDQAGVRLEIPYNLQTSLKALESISYNLKQKNKKMRRNIKFDDQEQDLVLDFNPDPEGGAAWKRVTAQQAKKMKTKRSGQTEAVTDSELNDMINL